MIHLNQFQGLLPRVPPELLPPNHASQADNCDFAYGELRTLRGNALIKALRHAARSIYTDNGLRFFSWDADVDVARAPLAHDRFDRLYYTDGADFRVTQRSGMRADGGPPAQSWRVGVPRPGTAPRLSLASSSPIQDCTLQATFHYEFASVKYQEQSVNLQTLTPFAKWRFTAPARRYTPPTRNPANGEISPPDPQDTPAQAIPVLRLQALRDGQSVLDLYSRNSSLDSSTVWALSLSINGAEVVANLEAASADAWRSSRVYVYTYVNIFQEEGPPSAPAVISVLPGQGCTIEVARDASVQDYAPLQEIRLYRSADGAQAETGAEVDYYYLGSIALAGQSGTRFAFLEQGNTLQEALSSIEYEAPPPNLQGLLALPNGILMAWRGNALHFSAAYQPWAWPPSYVKTLGDCQIVGAIAVGGGALVTTTSRPYLISGITPDAMTEIALNLWQAGVSKWALADIGGQIVYASHDGIVALDGGQPTLTLSQRFFTRETWRARYGAGLDSMRFAVSDGCLLAYSARGAFTPFLLRLDEAQGALCDLPDLRAACSFTSPLADQTYLVDGVNLLQFGAGQALQARWTSREFVFADFVQMAIAQIACSGLWQVEIYADGVLRHRESDISGASSFRLPAGRSAQRWRIVLQGAGVVREIRLAASARSLRQMS